MSAAARCTLTALLLTTVSCGDRPLAAERVPQTAAAAARIGFERNLAQPLIQFDGGANDEDWSRPLDDAFPGARSVRVEVRVEAKGQGEWKIEIAAGERVALSVTPDMVSASAEPQSYWSQEIRLESHPSIKVTGTRAGLKFSIPTVVSLRPDFTPHVFVGGDQRTAVGKIADANIRTAAQSVGSLRFMRKSSRPERRGYFGCTASLVAPGLLLTAAHCVADTESGERLTFAEFELFSEQRATAGNKILSVSTRSANILPGAGQDYAFLRLAGKAPQVASLKLSRTAIKQDAALLLVQDSIEGNSGGVPAKQISEQGCVCTAEQVGPNFVHACDAINTSSGGPLLRHDGVLVGIHVGGMTSGAESENYGLALKIIADNMGHTTFGEKVGQELTFVP